MNLKRLLPSLPFLGGPRPSAIEASTGIRITQVGLTEAGRLVDLRFKILNASRARKLLGDPANMPLLVAGESLPLVPVQDALLGVKFGNGLDQFILYPNVRGAVKPGAVVMVAIGDARLGPVTVQ